MDTEKFVEIELEFYHGTPDRKEEIIEELTNEGEIEEAEKLQQWLNEENELKEAQNKGSEDGVDKWQDKD